MLKIDHSHPHCQDTRITDTARAVLALRADEELGCRMTVQPGSSTFVFEISCETYARLFLGIAAAWPDRQTIGLRLAYAIMGHLSLPLSPLQVCVAIALTDARCGEAQAVVLYPLEVDPCRDCGDPFPPAQLLGGRCSPCNAEARRKAPRGPGLDLDTGEILPAPPSTIDAIHKLAEKLFLGTATPEERDRARLAETPSSVERVDDPPHYTYRARPAGTSEATAAALDRLAATKRKVKTLYRGSKPLDVEAKHPSEIRIGQRWRFIYGGPPVGTWHTDRMMRVPLAGGAFVDVPDTCELLEGTVVGHWTEHNRGMSGVVVVLLRDDERALRRIDVPAMIMHTPVPPLVAFLGGPMAKPTEAEEHAEHRATLIMLCPAGVPLEVWQHACAAALEDGFSSPRPEAGHVAKLLAPVVLATLQARAHTREPCGMGVPRCPHCGR
jgi:hypothetical protein